MFLATKAFAADLTSEWILVGVTSLMVCQMLFPSIFFTTHIARVRSFTSMPPRKLKTKETTSIHDI